MFLIPSPTPTHFLLLRLSLAAVVVLPAETEYSSSFSSSFLSSGGCCLRTEERSETGMLGSGMNLITTVIGFGMSTTFIVFICARLLCGRMRSAEARAAAALAAPTAYDLELQSEPDLPENSPRSVEPVVVVASLPAINYKKGVLHNSDDSQCSICLGDYQEKEVLRIIPNCGHDFHLICIDAWLEKQSTCPICRLSLHDLNQPPKCVASPFSRGIQTLNISDPVLPMDQNLGHETAHTNLEDVRIEQLEER